MKKLNNKELVISVIIPFYNGNLFINSLIKNLDKVKRELQKKCIIDLEVIIVNDSPEIKVEYINVSKLNIKVINNLFNVGIHKSRVNGLEAASGEWIIFLDQDDLLIPDGILSALKKLDTGDVVVSNGFYERKGKKERIYNNISSMKYLVREEKFIKIRNLIASPGQCLIRRAAVPEIWQKNIIKQNGADDWYLWLLLFNEKAKFEVNNQYAYVHRSTEHGNISFNYEKMYLSCREMLDILREVSYPDKKEKKLARAIHFKYLKDIHRINLLQYLYYLDRFIDNVIYKINLAIRN